MRKVWSRRAARRLVAVAATVVALTAAVTVSTNAFAASAACEIANDFTLGLDDQVTACGGGYRLVLQKSDGNLVLYRDGDGAALWSTGTSNRGVTSAVMQSDGNLVVYAGGSSVWDAKTGGSNGARLAVQGDGNLVIYQGGTAIWDRHHGLLADNTRPTDGTNCEPAFVVQNYGGVQGALGYVSAGHCDTKGKVAFAVGGEWDFEIIQLDANRLNAPTTAGGQELRSANYFRSGSANGDSFASTDRSGTVHPTQIGANSGGVCRFGGKSPTTCGNIVQDTYAPSYVPNAANFYLLDFPCEKGDSGAAVVSADGTRAVGIISGRRIRDGACIVSRLDRVFPGELTLYQAPRVDSTYTLMWFHDDKWYVLSNHSSRAICVKAVESSHIEAKNLRCTPNEF